ncbi:hypothetical protein GCM10011316_15500 [Roseibium aquae]|uniref:DUF192 domain-containing protein n=1 Tax=Roseibium aquae TaxID=1323746 RepID=A0A916TGZ7_9HYPH|nr:DUF192 domain-containing protein [Roseibium aquae]GGB44376.1 hypothetical protein GCM10011316_15500 [Roseibium aquae]
MTLFRMVLLQVFALVLVAGHGWMQPVRALDPLPLDLPTEVLTVETADGPLEFTVEVAATPEARSRGLMFRRDMAEDHGMLFVFENEGERHFWMKNTPLSLDIVFIRSGGRIGHIAKSTTPFSEEIIPSRGPALYVLEVLAGIADQKGIAEGAAVRSPSIRAGSGVSE